MNYEKIKKGLSKYDPQEVTRYINYLKFLETDKDRDKKPRNPWFNYVKESQLIDIYKKVAIDNLSIDGETITLQYKGKLMANYDYQAYKNKLLSVYPETTFDLQLVSKGDEFSFRKASGKVIYSHKINDPFNPHPEIIGTYCIIKNRRGEFLETLNITDINKMRAVAKTQKIWDTWFSEMVLKSVIKRACKRHFKDITHNIENIDNENNDLEKVDVEVSIQKKVEKVKTIEELNQLYKDEKDNVTDEVGFITLLKDKKEELRQLLPELKDKHEAIEMLKNGKKPDDLLNKWKITPEQMETIISEAV